MKKDTAPLEKKERFAFEALSVRETEEALKTDTQKGLSAAEAAERLEKFGKNKLAEKKKKTPFGIFLEQLNNPMIFVLLAAIAVTVAVSVFETVSAARMGWIVDGVKIQNAFMELGDWPDVLIIFAVIMINGIMYTVEDRGGSGIENDIGRVDIFVPDHNEALRMGRYDTTAYIYRIGR